MVWNYSGDPTSTPKDEVRFLIGDTNSATPLVQDQEILYMLEEFSDPILAASYVAESLAGKHASSVSISGDGLSWSGGELSSKYSELAQRLRLMYQRKFRAAKPYAGGLSHAEREKDDLDQDLPSPAFRSEMHDHPEALRDDVARRTAEDW